MKKPRKLAHASSAALRALLKGGHKINLEDLKEMARWAIHQELQAREYENAVIQGYQIADEDLEERISELEEELNEARDEHTKEIEALKEEHEKALVEQAKGAEITL